jgi:hypothetical protein
MRHTRYACTKLAMLETATRVRCQLLSKSGENGVSADKLPRSEIIFYQTEDGNTRVQCRFDNETLWLTQAQIAELFQTTPQNVTLHLKAI